MQSYLFWFTGFQRPTQNCVTRAQRAQRLFQRRHAPLRALRARDAILLGFLQNSKTYNTKLSSGGCAAALTPSHAPLGALRARDAILLGLLQEKLHVYCRREELVASVRKLRENLCASAFHLSKTRKTRTQSGRRSRPLLVSFFSGFGGLERVAINSFQRQ